MSGETAGVIVACVSALGALAGTLYTARTARQSHREDTAVAAWEKLLQPIRDRLAECEKELQRQRTWRREAVGVIRRLTATHQNPPELPPGFEVEEG